MISRTDTSRSATAKGRWRSKVKSWAEAGGTARPNDDPDSTGANGPYTHMAYVRCLNGSISWADVPLRHRVAGNAVLRGPLVARHVVGAEDPIDPRHVHREILVDGLRRRAVVPVMESRHHEHPLQPAAPKPDVRVDEHRVKRHKYEIGVHGRRREAQQHYWNQSEPSGDDDVDQVEARSGNPVERDARVMDRVKPPERGHRVKEPMRRVLAEVGDDHHLDKLQRQRLRLDGLMQPGAAGRRRDHGCRHHRQQRRDLDQQVADEEMQRVGGPAGAEHFLGRPLRKQPLERDEDHGEQQQVQQEPVEAQVEPPPCRAVNRHVGPAEQQRRQRQPDAGDGEGLACPQQRRQQPEQETCADDKLDHGTHHGQRIARPQIDLGQQLRVVQAGDRAQAQGAEKDGGRAAEPASADVGGLVVAKNAGEPLVKARSASDRHAP